MSDCDKLGLLCGLCLLVLASLFPTKSYAAPPFYKVGLINQDRPPYFSYAKGKATGIYIDVLEEIARHIAIKLKYISLPQARLRRYMKIGQLDIEPGISPKWRQKQGEVAASFYSHIFMRSPEIYIYHPKSYIAFPTPDILNKYLFCGVRGFNHLAKNSKRIYEILTEQQILGMLSRQRCEYALMPQIVYQHINKQAPYMTRPSRPIVTYALRFRFHIDHINLQVPFNTALDQIHKNGKLERIFKTYIQDNSKAYLPVIEAQDETG